MRCIFLVFCLISINFLAFTQCLTTYHKVSPERYKNPFGNEFGKSIDVLNNIAVVGIPYSDSLQNNSGIALIYEFNGSEWIKLATLRPSNPMPYLLFGESVAIVENTIVVTGYSTNSIPSSKGGIYVFEKPVGGWKDMPETALLTLSNSNDLKGFGKKVSINQEETAIATFLKSNVYIFPKNGPSWTSSSAPEIIELNGNPEISDVSIDNLTLAVGLLGSTLVYKALDDSWTQVDKTTEITKASDSYYYFGNRVKLYNNHLLVHALSYDTDSIFVYSTTDGWITINAGIGLTSGERVVNGGAYYNNHYYMDMDENNIVVARIDMESDETLITCYQKHLGAWDNTQKKHIRMAYRPYTPPPVAVSQNHLLVSGYLNNQMDNYNTQIYFYDLSKSSPELLQQFEYSENNTSGDNFGRKVVLNDNVLAISSAYDPNSGILHQGMVGLYEKNNLGNWELLHLVRPENINKNMNFGFSIAFYDDYLVIGAPSYQEDNTTRSTGRVFVYKKTGNSWNTIKQIAILQPSNWHEAAEESMGQWLSFGYSLAVDANTIIVGAPGKDGSQGQQDFGQIYIFEKSLNQEWQSGNETAILKVSNPFPNIALGRFMTYHNQTIFSSGQWSNSYNHGYIYTFKRPSTGWNNATETEILTMETNAKSYSGFFGGSIEYYNGLLFVGSPHAIVEGNLFAGQISVIQNKDANWSTASVVSNIVLKKPEAFQVVGSAFSIKENVLVMGSSYIIGNTYLHQEELKGKAIVVQALDNLWRETIELLILDGDKNFPIDGFGYSIDSNGDDLIVGAHYDDSETGFSSGAVYYIPMPPTVQLMEPVCQSSEPIALNAYPSGGIWSGSGIMDGTENKFHPQFAGVGEHELTYRTENCYYDGKIKITVLPDFEINFISSENPIICENKSFRIEANPLNGAKYIWHYHPDHHTDAISSETENPFIDIDIAGYYVLQVEKDGCTSISDTVHTRKLEKNIVFDPLPIICNDSQSYVLSVEPSGGMWQNSAISGNMINPAQLGQGFHELIYEVTMENTCIYSDTLTVNIDLLSPVKLNLGSELCEAKGAVLQATPILNTNYVLEKNEQGGYVKHHEDSLGIFYLKNGGRYRVAAYKHSCTNVSDEVDFKPEFVLTMETTTSENKFCEDTGYNLIAEKDVEVIYVWEYLKNNGWNKVGTDNATLLVTQEGKYRLTATKNHCLYTSPEYDFTMYPQDSIFIPNVVTANDDGINEKFEVKIKNAEILNLTIFNRWGDRIYHVTDYNNTWPSSNVPSGIYYYQIVFRTPCNKNPRPLVGWLHLLK